MENLLKEAYNPEHFRTLGYELIDVLTTYLKDAQQGTIPVVQWTTPSEQLRFWEDYTLDSNAPTTLFKDIIARSMHVHHPKYMGHQIAPTVPLAALSGLVSALLNNGAAIYEMGSSSTAIEKLVIQSLTQKAGYGKNSDGFMTSGGTLANLTALLAARKVMAPSDVWEEGHRESLGVMVSSEAHYCIDRALRIMGFGSKGIVKVPVGASFKMNTELLNTHYEHARKNGIRIIAVVGSAPSTSTGMYDDLEAIARFCAEKNLWFHVDGAHGGAAVFSSKYKHLLRGMEHADSIVIDGHKMLMTPSIMTFLLFKEQHHSYSAFSQKAQYLLEKSEQEEWYNLAHRTFECTKHMMSIKYYVLLKYYGEAIFDQFVTRLYDLGRQFAAKVKQHKHLELALDPESNIVCFRYIRSGLSVAALNARNSAIRNTILEKGAFYIVQTTLQDQVYLRVTLMNPETSPEVIDELLTTVEAIGGGEATADSSL